VLADRARHQQQVTNALLTGAGYVRVTTVLKSARSESLVLDG
jgi:hypothetical protein